MDLQLKEVDFQEISDYGLLYKMFGDSEYKEKVEKLLNTVEEMFRKCVREGTEYLMLCNLVDDDKNNTYYTTVIKVVDFKTTYEKIMMILKDLGNIDYIKQVNYFGGSTGIGLEIKIKDSYKLYLYDFTIWVV